MPTSPPELRSITLIQLDIRDAQLVKGSERLLLDAIALRGNRKQHYTCFPAYALLSRDTQVSVRQLKDSAQSLVKKGLIKMRVRPNQSTIYQVQFEYIHGLAEEKRAEAKRKKQEIASLNDLRPCLVGPTIDASTMIKSRVGSKRVAFTENSAVAGRQSPP